MSSSSSSKDNKNNNYAPNKNDNFILGTSDAASSYYFSTMPKTPAITSSIQKLKKKKQYLKSKSSTAFDTSIHQNSTSSSWKKGHLDKENIENARIHSSFNLHHGDKDDESSNKKQSNNGKNAQKPLSDIPLNNNTDNTNENNNEKQRYEKDQEHTTDSLVLLEQQLDNYMNDISLSSSTSSNLLSSSLLSKSESTVNLDSILNNNTKTLVAGATYETTQSKQKKEQLPNSKEKQKKNRRISTNSNTTSSSIDDNDYEEEDTLNKSVLSDTTELTASHYVFAAQAKQRLMMNELYELKKSLDVKKKNDDDDSNSNMVDKGNKRDVNLEEESSQIEKKQNQNLNESSLDQENNDTEKNNKDLADDNDDYENNECRNVSNESIVKDMNENDTIQEHIVEQHLDTEEENSKVDDNTIGIISKKLESSIMSNSTTSKNDSTHDVENGEKSVEENEDTMDMLQDLIHNHVEGDDLNIIEVNDNDDAALSTENVVNKNKIESVINSRTNAVDEAPTNVSNLETSLSMRKQSDTKPSNRLSISSTSPSIINLRQRALNARRLTSSIQKLKQRRESERKERRRRISTGGFMMESYMKKRNGDNEEVKSIVRQSRYSLPAAPNLPIPFNNQRPQQVEAKKSTVKGSSLTSNQTFADGSRKNEINVVVDERAILNETFDGGHEQLKGILGELVDNKDSDDDDDSDVSSIDRNFDLSKASSPPTKVNVNYSNDSKVHNDDSDDDVSNKSELICNNNKSENESSSKTGKVDLTNPAAQPPSTPSPVNKSTTFSSHKKIGSSKSTRIYVPSPGRHTRSSSKKRKNSISVIGSLNEMVSTVTNGVESSVIKRMNSNPTPEKMKRFNRMEFGSLDENDSSHSKRNENVSTFSTPYANFAKSSPSSSKSPASSCEDTENFLNYLAVDVPQKENNVMSHESSIISKFTSEDKAESTNTSNPTLGSVSLQDLDDSNSDSSIHLSHSSRGSIGSMSLKPSLSAFRGSSVSDEDLVNATNSSSQNVGSKRKTLTPTPDQGDNYLSDSMIGQSLHSKSHDFDSDNQDDSDEDVRNEFDETKSSCGSDTADTMALHEIMADLIPNHASGKLKRRRKSIIGIVKGPIHSETTDEAGKTSNTDSDSVADTQDIKRLFSKLGSSDSTISRGSSNGLLATITEDDDKINVQLKAKIVQKQIASQLDEGDIEMGTNNETQIGIHKPKSILNSSKKDRRMDTPKKSVEFRPPIAAEFNVGSPSMSITPMCAKKVKSLYKIPCREDSATSSSSPPCSEQLNFSPQLSRNSEKKDQHLDSQAFENGAMDSENSDYSNQSLINESDTISLGDCSIQQMSGGDTAVLETNLKGFLKCINTGNVSFDTMNHRSPGIHRSSDKETLSESKTIDLEKNLHDLLMQANENESRTSSEEEQHGSISLQTIDTASLEKDNSLFETSNNSTNSNRSKALVKSHSQYMNSSIDSQTVDLETNMKGLLGKIADENQDTDMIDVDTISNTTSTSVQSNKDMIDEISGNKLTPSVDLQGPLEKKKKILNSDNNDRSSQSTVNSEILHVDDSQTVDLETDVQSLLRIVSSATKMSICPSNDEIPDSKVSNNNEMDISLESFKTSNEINVEYKSKECLGSEIDTNGIEKSECLQKLDRSEISTRSQIMHLEMNLQDLLDNAGSHSIKSPQLQDSVSKSGSSMSFENETAELDSNLQNMLKNLRSKNDSMGSTRSKTDSLQTSAAGKTIETDIQEFCEVNSDKVNTSTSEEKLSTASSTSDPPYISKGDSERLLKGFKDSYANNDQTSRSDISMKNLSMNGCSVSQTIALETDMQDLLDNISSHDAGAAGAAGVDKENLTPNTVASQLKSNGNSFSSKSLKYSISEDASTLASNLHGLVHSLDTRSTQFLHTSDRGGTESSIEGQFQKKGLRVSLVPQENISLLDEADIGPEEVINDQYLPLLGKFEVGPEDVIANQSFKPEELDMKWEEVFGNQPQQIQNEVEDKYISNLLPELVQAALSQSSYSSLQEKINTFLTNVCEKMERDAAEDNEDVEEIFAEFCDNYTDHMLLIQKILRGQANETVRLRMKEMLQSSNELINETTMLDFNDWEMQVVLALVARIKSNDFDHNDERMEIRRRMNLAENLHDSLTLISKKAIKKARRKSLDGRKANTSSLEQEINQIEDRIAEMETELGHCVKEQKEIKLTSDLLKSHNTCQSQVKIVKTDASRSFDKFKSMEGIFSWIVKEIDESSLCLEIYETDIPGLAVSVMVQDEMSTKSLSARVSLNKDSQNVSCTPLSSVFSENVLSFIESSVTQKCEKLCNATTRMATSCEIFEKVNQIEWYIGRLSLSGREITGLEKRYNGTLRRSGEMCSTFTLQLSIKTKQLCAIAASFEICEAYPFVLPTVELSSNEECIDIKALERHLMKSSRPGFGYLSRTCHTIACFTRLQNEQ